MIIILIRVLTVIFFIFILWIIFLANTGRDSIFFELIASLPYGDKLGHFCLFGALTLGSIFTFKFKSFSLGWFNVYWGTFLVTLFVMLEELSQGLIPSRTLDITDLLADAFGIAIFTAISYYFSRLFSSKNQN